ncbi:hypothetical protein GGR30_000617 [Martelella radicis]|uniref:Uncharacterized protein n=1 Tax=Martelella radicis TaxID=1397476 RepID=A0A7W6KGP5_9HYPH|nr:hypothetical protein [Martelella radicis]
MSIDHIIGFFCGTCIAITAYSLIGGIAMRRSLKRTEAILSNERPRIR